MTSNIDRKLISFAGNKTYEEISELTGVPALEVAKRTQEVLSNIGVLEIDQRRAKLMIQLEGIVNEVDSRKESASNRDLGALLNSSRSAIQTVLKELREIEKSSKVDVQQITSYQGKVLGEIVDIAVGHLRAELKERYNTDDSEMDEILQEGMSLAAKELDSRVSE